MMWYSSIYLYRRDYDKELLEKTECFHKTYKSDFSDNDICAIYKRGEFLTVKIAFDRIDCTNIKEQEAVVLGILNQLNMNLSDFKISRLCTSLELENLNVCNLLRLGQSNRNKINKNTISFDYPMIGKRFYFTQIGNNVLYQMYLKRRLQSKIKTNNASVLFNMRFIDSLTQMMMGNYNKIEKTNVIPKNIKTPTEAFEYIVGCLISEVGEDYVFKMIDHMKMQKIFHDDRKKYSRLKTKIIHIIKNRRAIMPNNISGN